jgi:hypothetical protein
VRWRDYIPQIGVWSVAGAGNVAPTLGTLTGAGIGAAEQQQGRYVHDPITNIVVYDFILQWGSVGNAAGTGLSPYYLVSLPVPCRLQMSNYLTGSIGGPQSSDRVIGHGHVCQSATENPQVPVLFVPSDQGATLEHGVAFGRTSRRQDFAQAFCPFVVMSGTVTTTAQTSVAVTWPGGITLYAAPNAGDIQVVPTNVGGAAAPFFITNVTTTGFTINFAAANTGAFTWKLLASSSSLLVGGNAPWKLGATALDVWRGHLVYEADIQ